MGLTFKENCSDLRNTRVMDVIRELGNDGNRPEVWDPSADPREAAEAYGIELIPRPEKAAYDAIIYDIKRVLPREATDGRL